MTMLRSALIVATLSLLALPAQAQLLGPNLAPPPAVVTPNADLNAALPPPRGAVDDRVSFNPAEYWIIPHFYERVREQQKRAARSKKYERALPAGLTENPAKGDRLPPTIVSRLDRLPGPLLRELPPNRPDTDRVVVGKNILMVRTSTGEVLDVMPNILH